MPICCAHLSAQCWRSQTPSHVFAIPCHSSAEKRIVFRNVRRCCSRRHLQGLRHPGTDLRLIAKPYLKTNKRRKQNGHHDVAFARRHSPRSSLTETGFRRNGLLEVHLVRIIKMYQNNSKSKCYNLFVIYKMYIYITLLILDTMVVKV